MSSPIAAGCVFVEPQYRKKETADFSQIVNSFIKLTATAPRGGGIIGFS